MSQGPAKTIVKKQNSENSSGTTAATTTPTPAAVESMAELCHLTLLKGMIQNGKARVILEAFEKTPEGRKELARHVKKSVSRKKVILVVAPGPDSPADGRYFYLDLAEVPVWFAKIIQTHVDRCERDSYDADGRLKERRYTNEQPMQVPTNRSQAGGWEILWDDKESAVEWCVAVIKRMSVSRAKIVLGDLGCDVELDNEDCSLDEALSQWFDDFEEGLSETLDEKLDDVTSYNAFPEWSDKKLFFGKTGSWQEKKPFTMDVQATLILGDLD